MPQAGPTNGITYMGYQPYNMQVGALIALSYNP